MTLPPYVTFLSLVLATGCGSGSSDDTAALDAMFDTLASVDQQFDTLVDEEGLDPHGAIEQLAHWLTEQPDVANAYALDETYVFFTTTEGLEAGLWFDEVDEAGNSLYRGSGAGGSPGAGDGSCDEVIANERILFFNAEPSFATPPETLDLIDTERFEVDACTGDACAFDRVAGFGDYGFVVLNTHGFPNGFMTGEVWSSPDAAAENLEAPLAEAVRGQGFKLVARKRRQIVPGSQPVPPTTDANTVVGYATSTHVAALPLMPSTVVFANHCYSGQTSTLNLPEGEVPIAEAWQTRQLISYYGYQLNSGQSLPVFSRHCREREQSLIQRLVVDQDATGHAHLDASDNEVTGGIDRRDVERFGTLYFRHFGHHDFCYDDCDPTFVDTRDSTTYAQVCVGSQVWMAENLNYLVPDGRRRPNDPDGTAFGTFYTPTTARAGLPGSSAVPSGVQGICPDDWHLPSDAEWMLLEAEAGMAGYDLEQFGTRGSVERVGRALKSESTWLSGAGANALGFDVKAAGMLWSDTPDFDDSGLIAMFQTSTTRDDSVATRGFVDIEEGGFDGVERWFTSPDLDGMEAGWSVRCVRD